MENIKDLVSKADEENLSAEEIDYVVKKLEEAKSNPDDNLYSYVYILGRGMYGKPIPQTYRKLMEYFMYYPQYPFVSTLALEILCRYWWMVNDYLDVLKQFIRGVEWDHQNEMKENAISNAGLYLKNTLDKELLSMLLNIFEKSNKDNESEDFLRLLAYCALGESQGIEVRYLPAYSSRLSDLEAKGLLDLDIIKRAHELLEAP